MKNISLCFFNKLLYPYLLCILFIVMCGIVITEIIPVLKSWLIPTLVVLLSDSLGDKAPGASSLECLSSIVDRLSSVESSCGPASLRDMATFSPGSSDSQPCTPESPGSRPVYHVLWGKLRFDVDILPQAGALLFTKHQLHLQQEEIRTSFVQIWRRLSCIWGPVASSFYIVHEIVNM